MKLESISPAEVHAVVGVPASTLRAWHNRVGFLPRHERGWRKYSFLDLLSIRTMKILTDGGIAAQVAADLIQKINHQLNAAVKGLPVDQIAVGKVGLSDEWIIEEIDPKALAGTALDFQNEVIFVLNLRAIMWSMYFALRRARGIDDPDPNELLDVLGEVLRS